MESSQEEFAALLQKLSGPATKLTVDDFKLAVRFLNTANHSHDKQDLQTLIQLAVVACNEKKHPKLADIRTVILGLSETA